MIRINEKKEVNCGAEENPHSFVVEPIGKSSSTQAKAKEKGKKKRPFAPSELCLTGAFAPKACVPCCLK